MQMATDEALLEAAQHPTLRCYTWDPPTLSLGYFQDWASVRASLPHPIAMVRRITGGGAIWHEHEVTYSLIGTLGQHGLPLRTRDCYPLLHSAIATALSAHTTPPALQAAAVGDRRYRDEPRCFASPAAADLVHDHAKVLGSAGRTRGQRVLIHGSLKLDTNPWDGSTVTGCGVSAELASQALVTGISTALGLNPEPGECTETEISARNRIRDQRYATNDWVEQRIGPRA